MGAIFDLVRILNADPPHTMVFDKTLVGEKKGCFDLQVSEVKARLKF